MTEYCKGCGVQLQNEDPDALGYVPKLDASYSFEKRRKREKKLAYFAL